MPKLTFDGAQIDVMAIVRYSLAACAAICLSLASASRADEAKENAQNRKFMHDYAKCVVKSKPSIAAEAIMSNADNTTIMKQYPLLVDGVCLNRVAGNVSMRFGGDLFRYALADALVNDTLAARLDTSFEDRPELAHLPFPSRTVLDAEIANTRSPRKREEIERRFDSEQGVAWLSRYGECVTREEPVKSRLWLLTPPGGPEETSRINDLRKTFAACLGDGTMKFNRVVMRGTVAINYYRLAMATPVAGKSL